MAGVYLLPVCNTLELCVVVGLFVLGCKSQIHECVGRSTYRLPCVVHLHLRGMSGLKDGLRAGWGQRGRSSRVRKHCSKEPASSARFVVVQMPDYATHTMTWSTPSMCTTSSRGACVFQMPFTIGASGYRSDWPGGGRMVIVVIVVVVAGGVCGVWMHARARRCGL